MSKRGAESGNSPPTKRSRINISQSLTQEITAHMTKHTATVLYQQKKVAHSIYGTTTQMVDFHRLHLPVLIPELVRYCQTLSLARLDLWFAEESNCRLQLTKLADSSVMSLGDLLFSILDKEEVKEEEDSWEGVLKHELFNRPDTYWGDPIVFEEESREATIKSWGTTYVGGAAKALMHYVQRAHKDDTKREYANHISIVQSSGMGKSRMVDEVSKTNFLIPLCLRSSTSGFPAADAEVRDFLTNKCDEATAMMRAHAFIAALFESTTTWVERQTPATIEKIAENFRLYMTQNQEHNRPNKNRAKFYQEVVGMAERYTNNFAVEPAESSISPEPVKPALSSRRRTPSSSEVPESKPSPKHIFKSHSKPSETGTITEKAELLIRALQEGGVGTPPGPLILVSFDESHTLTVGVEDAPDDRDKPKPTYFTCLRRALRALVRESVFSFFLSTTGEVFQFTFSRELDPSNRIQEGRLRLIPPYSDIGFDQLAQKVDENTLTIEEVAFVEFMVMLGRPLFAARYLCGDPAIQNYIVEFAAEKLLNRSLDQELPLTDAHKLACLSVRLALDFNPYTADARQKELNLIENHLRVCVQVGSYFDRVKSVSPSEPLLGEAARKIMREFDFRPANALLTEFRRPDIERGPRGEVIMTLMVTLASDMIAKLGEPFLVIDFMKSLFGGPSTDPEVDDFMQALPSAIHPEVRSTYGGKPFHETFANAKMHFNHFVKVADYKVINRDYLWRMILRGAAVLCANNQAGVDFILPYSYSDKELGRLNVGAMFWQIKNDARFGGLPHPYLFDAMDPYKLGTFDEQDEDANIGGIPIIRVVAALASKVPLLRNFLYNDVRNSKAKDPKEKAKQQNLAKPAKKSKEKQKADDPGTRKKKGKAKQKAVSRPQRPPRSYTAYDFYCGGLTPAVWRPMTRDTVVDWEALLDQSGAWDRIFKSQDDDTEGIRRSQMPGATSHPAHWSRFSSFEETSAEEFEEEDVNVPEMT